MGPISVSPAKVQFAGIHVKMGGSDVGDSELDYRSFEKLTGETNAKQADQIWRANYSKLLQLQMAQVPVKMEAIKDGDTVNIRYRVTDKAGRTLDSHQAPFAPERAAEQFKALLDNGITEAIFRLRSNYFALQKRFDALQGLVKPLVDGFAGAVAQPDPRN